MRQFKIKNLLIRVLPESNQFLAELAAECGSACSLNLTDYTKDCCAGGCSNVPSGACFPCSNITGKGFSSFDPADLVFLKAQLQLALQEVEVREQVLDERLRVHTSEQANALEAELTAALAEVKSLKSRLPSEANQGKK